MATLPTEAQTPLEFSSVILNRVLQLVDEKSEGADDWIADLRGEIDNIRSRDPLQVPEPGAKATPPRLGAVPSLVATPATIRTDFPGTLPTPSSNVPGMPSEPRWGDAPKFDDLDDLDPSSLLAEIKAFQRELVESLKEEFENFARRWFPDETNIRIAEAWLKDVMEGRRAVSPLAEQRIWERDRARLNAEAAGARSAALTQWASRGYALPPGALVGQVAGIDLGLSKSLAQQSRDIAIKAHQDLLETGKFAVQQAIEMRSNAMRATTDYIQALASVSARGFEIASMRSDLAARIASARASIYSSTVDGTAKVYSTQASAAVEAYRTVHGTIVDSYRAQVAGAQTRASTDADVFRAQSAEGLERYRVMHSTMLETFKSDLALAELNLRRDTTDAQLKVDVDKTNQAQVMALLQEKVKVFTAAADMMGRQCQAAINALQMSARVSNDYNTQFRYETPS